MLTGELEYRRGNFDLAFAHLRRAVELDDSLPYDEPWGWMQPTRHALGALLLEQGHLAEAEAVYRADLGFDGKTNRACWHPENVWSLHGLHECLSRRGETVEAPLIKARLDLASARTEFPVRASCLWAPRRMGLSSTCCPWHRTFRGFGAAWSAPSAAFCLLTLRLVRSGRDSSRHAAAARSRITRRRML
jgi:hypothetical protein